MYMHTTFKAFVAKAATEFMKEFMNEMNTLNLTGDEMKVKFERYAMDAIEAASTLAEELTKWWDCKGDQKTIFFDVLDSLTSNIERELSEITDKLQDISLRLIDED